MRIVGQDGILPHKSQSNSSTSGVLKLLVVLTTDHGVATVPEGRGAGGARTALRKANWVLNAAAEAIYLDRALMRQKKLDSA